MKSTSPKALSVILLVFSMVPDVGAQQPIANDRASQSCDQLHQRGPAFEPLANACRYAVAMPRTLPDFVCTENVTRYMPSARKPDIITAELTIEQTKSHYAAVTLNGKALPGQGNLGDILFEEQAGSTGEFALLFNVFDAASRAEFAPPVDVVVDRTRLKRYDYRVKRENNSAWRWLFVNNSINPGYHGSVFVDGATGMISRLLVQVTQDEVDPETPISATTTTIDYGDVFIAEAGTHHIPIKGENTSCFRILGGCMRTTMTFTNFHKFGSVTRILPQ